MQDYYQTFAVEDYQKDEIAISLILGQIMNRALPNDLRLLNYFKEVPICFAATIENVEPGLVKMTVHHTQSIAIQSQKMSFLKSSHLPHDVVAKVQRLRIAKSQVVFTQFSFAQIRSERRENVRVKVTEAVSVDFRSGKLLVRGRLDDISSSGLTILAPAQPGCDQILVGTVYFALSGIAMEVPATLLRVLDVDGAKKYVIKLDAGPKEERLVSQFIFQIQTDIIRELKERA